MPPEMPMRCRRLLLDTPQAGGPRSSGLGGLGAYGAGSEDAHGEPCPSLGSGRPSLGTSPS